MKHGQCARCVELAAEVAAVRHAQRALDEDQQYAETMRSVARLLRADSKIAALAERLWRVHPKEIQDLGVTRQQYYEREIRTAFDTINAAAQCAPVETIQLPLWAAEDLLKWMRKTNDRKPTLYPLGLENLLQALVSALTSTPGQAIEKTDGGAS